MFGVYNRSARLPAQHAALERWGRLIEDAIEGRFSEEAEVIPLARTRASLIILTACLQAPDLETGHTTRRGQFDRWPARTISQRVENSIPANKTG